MEIDIHSDKEVSRATRLFAITTGIIVHRYVPYTKKSRNGTKHTNYRKAYFDLT